MPEEKESVLKKCMAVAVLLASVLLMASSDKCKVPRDDMWDLRKCMSGDPGASMVTWNGKQCPSLNGKTLCCDRCLGSQCGKYINGGLENTDRDNGTCNAEYADLCARLIVNHFHDNCKKKNNAWDCGSGPTYSQLSSALHNWCKLNNLECNGVDDNGDPIIHIWDCPL